MRLRRAQAVLGAARTMRSLLDSAPAHALLVHPDGRVDADGRIIRDLGLETIPTRLDELARTDAGFDKDDLEELGKSLEEVRLGGQAIRRQLRLSGSERVVELRAALAP